MSYNYGVPRNDEQVGQLLSDRPPGWEYMLYAGVLVLGLERLELKYSDYSLGYAARRGTVIPAADFFHFMQSQLNEFNVITSSLDLLFNNEVMTDALGPPGVAGDPDKIFHAASRVTRLYEDMMLWAERLRSLAMPEEFYRAAELLARFSEQPINELRSFIFRLAERMNILRSEIDRGDEGDPIVINEVVKFTVPEAIRLEYLKALKSVKDVL